MNHTTTVTKHEDGTATLDCTCGEHVTYSLHQFTVVEARRHEDWHAKVGR